MIKKKKILIAEDMPEFHSDIEAMPVEDKIFVDKSVEIAEYVFQLIEEKGMKQKDLAEKMGKTEAEVSRILGGMHNLTLRSIAKLEAALESIIICTPGKESQKQEGKVMTKELKDVVSSVPNKISPKMNYENHCKIINLKKGNNEDGGTSLPMAG